MSSLSTGILHFQLFRGLAQNPVCTKSRGYAQKAYTERLAMTGAFG